MSTEYLLKSMLSLAVPLRAHKMLAQPIEHIFDKQVIEANIKAICERGEYILFKSKVRGESAEMFNILADSITRLSFSPGGVCFMGMRFEYKHGTPWTQSKHGVPDTVDKPIEDVKQTADALRHITNTIKRLKRDPSHKPKMPGD